jgi:hypothetical protein
MQSQNAAEFAGEPEMKTFIMLAVIVISLTGLSAVIKQENANAQQSPNANGTSAQVSQSAIGGAQAGNGSAQATGSMNTNATVSSRDAHASANGAATASTEMQPVNCELLGKLNSKTAKAGDSVVVKTKEQVKTADGTVIPKGSRLVGHVTDVQAHGSGRADSSMSIAFDRAELKSGRAVPIHSVIQSVAPSASAMAASQMSDDESLAGPMGGRAGMAGGARAVGGGRSGGLLGGTANTAGSVTGGATSSLGSTAGNSLRTTGGMAANTTAGVGNGLHGAADATSSLAAHTTGIPGVMLAGDASGTASGTLSASRHNVELESGTQMVLGVSAAGMRR